MLEWAGISNCKIIISLADEGLWFEDDLEGSPNSGSQGSEKVTFELKMMKGYQKLKKSPTNALR